MQLQFSCPFGWQKCARKGLSHCDIFIRQAEDSRENKVDFRYSRRPRGFSPQQSHTRARFVTVTRLLELSKLTGICDLQVRRCPVWHAHDRESSDSGLPQRETNLAKVRVRITTRGSDASGDSANVGVT